MRIEINPGRPRKIRRIKTEVSCAQRLTVVSLWGDHRLGVNARKEQKFNGAEWEIH